MVKGIRVSARDVGATTTWVEDRRVAPTGEAFRVRTLVLDASGARQIASVGAAINALAKDTAVVSIAHLYAFLDGVKPEELPRRRATPEDQYPSRLTRAIAMLPDTAKVLAIRIVHDEWCDRMHERGYCNCHPFVFFDAEDPADG